TEIINQEEVSGIFIGPRAEMVSPWSTNAVEITQNMAINGISRMEEFFIAENENTPHDAMLQVMYKTLNQSLFTVNVQPEPVQYMEDIAAYNKEEGLALNDDEVI